MNNRMVKVGVVLFLLVFLVGCAKTGNSLKLEEHSLRGAPQVIPLTFEPVKSTQAEIMAAHATERGAKIAYEITAPDGNPLLESQGELKDLQATVFTATTGQPMQTVQLLRGGEVIFQTPGGLPSPAVPVQALWTYDGHWALEVLYSDETTWAGRVFIDGKMVNEEKGYEEAFGLQLLDGKPFFFYKRDGKIGYSYDGDETALGYDEIPHYYCCAETEMNPAPAEKMVAFFAERESTWYYVELGVFK